MEYVARQDGRIGETMFIRVLPAVLDRPGIVFCTEVSIKAGASVRPLEEVDEYIDLEAVYSRTDWKDPEVQKRRNLMKKFEILIPDHIPVELLRKPLSG